MKNNIDNKTKNNSILVVLLFFLSIATLVLPTLSNAQLDNYPGGIIDFEITKESTNLPEIKYGIQDVAVIDQPLSWRVLLGLDLKTIPGEYLIYIKRQSEDSTAYNQKFVVQQQEARFINAALDSQVTALYHDSFSDVGFYNTVQPELPLSYPAQGLWADHFGYINTNPETDSVDTRNYLSLTTTELIPVTAPQNAIVSRIIDNTTENNDNPKRNYTLFLDHGRGLFSVISGVSDITIELGNGVKAGAVLGKIYSNENNNAQPRTLIWQTILNGAYINPSILTKL